MTLKSGIPLALICRMIRRSLQPTALAVVLALSVVGCTGGQETSAKTLDAAEKAKAEGADVDVQARLSELSPSIPFYAGAEYRDDFTRRDEVMIRNQYGKDAEVLTLASDDSLPKIWHYYVTYLAQYRAYEPPAPFPPEKKDWRSLEVNLSEAMQDPFVPGTNLKSTDRNIILQVAETEAEPRTIIRYIVTPAAAPEAPVIAQ